MNATQSNFFGNCDNYGEGLLSFAGEALRRSRVGSMNAAVKVDPETQAKNISVKLVWCDNASVIGRAAVTAAAALRNKDIISFLFMPQSNTA